MIKNNNKTINDKTNDKWKKNEKNEKKWKKWKKLEEKLIFPIFGLRRAPAEASHPNPAPGFVFEAQVALSAFDCFDSDFHCDTFKQ